MLYMPKVIQAVAGDDFTVYAYFDDGAIRKADVKPLIAAGGVFAPLADETFFRERLTVLNDAVAWDISGNLDPRDCVDLDPVTVYNDCPAVPDPLERVG